MSEGKHTLVLCRQVDVAPGGALKVEAGGMEYAVFNVEGNIYVTQDHCTHGPGSLSEGYVLDDEIECPFHQGRFHIPTGQPTEAPCTEPIKVWRVNLVDGMVCIDPDEHGEKA